jgi:hypothetical protein
MAGNPTAAASAFVKGFEPLAGLSVSFYGRSGAGRLRFGDEPG